MVGIAKTRKDYSSVVVAIIRKIRTQFDQGMPEQRLMCAIVEKAIEDAILRRDVMAARYLRGQIPHAEICGVSCEWIHRVIQEVCDGAAIDFVL